MNAFPPRLSCPLCHQSVASADFYKHGFQCPERMDASARAERRRLESAAIREKQIDDAACSPPSPVLPEAGSDSAPGAQRDNH